MSDVRAAVMEQLSSGSNPIEDQIGALQETIAALSEILVEEGVLTISQLDSAVFCKGSPTIQDNLCGSYVDEREEQAREEQERLARVAKATNGLFPLRSEEASLECVLIDYVSHFYGLSEGDELLDFDKIVDLDTKTGGCIEIIASNETKEVSLFIKYEDLMVFYLAHCGNPWFTDTPLKEFNDDVTCIGPQRPCLVVGAYDDCIHVIVSDARLSRIKLVTMKNTFVYMRDDYMAIVPISNKFN